jgi:phosphoribosylaminoimidazole-succinocarboxamide synthase
MSSPELTHIHNEELEGPLPEGFPHLGREGKVRNIYIDESAGKICLIASDRVSAFDQVSPTPIPGKGEILNDIASRELEAAEDVQIPTWFEYVPEENPRAAVGDLATVLPVEMIFRNYMTGSMWREYKSTGDFQGFGLQPDLSEWQMLVPPMFTPSTKQDKDVNFHPKDVEEMTGLTTETLWDMEDIGRELFKLGTARAAGKGLVLVDTKYEMGVDSDGEIIVIDEVHTPDSSRFVIADGFALSILAGETPKSFSKEFLRGVMLGYAGGDVGIAKAMMANPLSETVVEETQARYKELQQRFTA